MNLYQKNNFKSILYKQRYYPICYRLSMINRNKFKIINDTTYIFTNYKILDKIPSCKYNHRGKNYKIISHNKFIHSYLIIEGYEDRLIMRCYSFNYSEHRLDGPAFEYYSDNGIFAREYYINGKRHRDPKEGPADIHYHSHNGEVWYEKYYVNGKLHRDPKEGPACICYKNSGDLWYMEYYVDDKRHRNPEEGPAYIKYHSRSTEIADSFCKIAGETRFNMPNGISTSIVYYENGDLVSMRQDEN